MTVREQLGFYIILQRLLDRRVALQREQETPPQELAQLRDRFAERDARLAELQRQSVLLNQDQGKIQQELETYRGEREHFRRQKSQVTNMKQLTAVVSELDQVESTLKVREDRLLEILEQLEKIDQEITSSLQESPEEKALRERTEAEWAIRRQGSEAELLIIKQDLSRTQQKLGENAMNSFKKLWTSRKPNAVAPLEGNACSACHAELRPALVQQVRAVEELTWCDHCRRLLYDPERYPVNP